MADRNVCSNSINGNKNETFNFKNENSNPVTVQQNGTTTWPFTTGPNLTVPAKVGSTAGTLSVTVDRPVWNLPICHCWLSGRSSSCEPEDGDHYVAALPPGGCLTNRRVALVRPSTPASSANRKLGTWLVVDVKSR